MGSTTIQTAIKFDRDLTDSMKQRARSLGKSVNRYVRELVEKDLAEANTLPRISLDNIHDQNVLRLSGILKKPDMSVLENDPRAKAIWER